MPKLNIRFLFPTLLLALLAYTLSTQITTVPPLGKIFDPFIGAVRNGEETLLLPRDLTIRNEALTESVAVYFDERNVPHIFAKNDKDLYFAQGYIAARLRLWQMDFITYATAGRLSEIFGRRFLEYDRHQRRLGVPEAARTSLALMERDAETREMLTAYTEGVNAYIRELTYATQPLEYKLLDYEPEPWTTLKSVLILKNMAKTLSGFESDVSMSNLMVALGEETFNNLFPDFHGDIQPVVNDDFSSAPAFAQIMKPEYLDYKFLSTKNVLSRDEFNPRLGSNSWAVSGSKTASGKPILCSDPHLGFSLPAIWLEMQLSCPGVNVYGVSIPGTPSIIIGFNDKIAWGLTNGAVDVKDWYKLKVTSDYTFYEFDGRWLPLRAQREEIMLKGEEPFIDTIYYSQHGPIVVTENFNDEEPELTNFALRWELHSPSNEFKTFSLLNRAKDHDDFLAALRHYSCPIQNFTYADKNGNIGIKHQGKLPLKYPGQGKFILDGTRSRDLIKGHIPFDSLPATFNPANGFVHSANQHPTNSTYPYYYNGYFSETRANQIYSVLASDRKFDVEKLKELQLNAVSFFASKALRTLCKYVDRGKLSSGDLRIFEGLEKWDGSYDMHSPYPKLYELWWENIKTSTWDELEQFTFEARPPDDYALLRLISGDSANIYFDRQGTSIVESASDIIHGAFVFSLSEYTKSDQREWQEFNKLNFMHPARIEPFSRRGVSAPGHPEAVNATSPFWGPSWRMVVELTEPVRAYGVYPGGQSGNPVSPAYDAFIDNWQAGKYYELLYFASEKEASARLTHKTMLINPNHNNP